MSNIPAYMHPATSAALLAHSRRERNLARVRRELRTALRKRGFDESACNELVQIHIEMNEPKLLEALK